MGRKYNFEESTTERQGADESIGYRDRPEADEDAVGMV